MLTSVIAIEIDLFYGDRQIYPCTSKLVQPTFLFIMPTDSTLHKPSNDINMDRPNLQTNYPIQRIVNTRVLIRGYFKTKRQKTHTKKSVWMFLRFTDEFSVENVLVVFETSYYVFGKGKKSVWFSFQHSRHWKKKLKSQLVILLASMKSWYW